MISGPRLFSVTAGLTGLALSLALVGPAAPAQSAPAPPQPVTVRSLALPVGKAPQIAWYQAEKRRVVRPGKKATPVRLKRPAGFFHVAGGWLVTTTCALCEPHTGTLHFLGTGGRTRKLHALKGWRVEVVASDGKTFVESQTRRRLTSAVYRIVRVRDGRVLHQRTFQGYWAGIDAAAASSSRVIMTSQQRNGRGVGTAVVQGWSVRTGKVRELQKHAVRSGSERTGAHLGADLVVAPQGNQDVVRSLRTGRALWRIPGGEGSLLFSPDGTRVATVGGFQLNDGQAFNQVIRIRDARTGRLRTTLTGYFADSPLTWENERTLLLTAGNSLLDVGDDEVAVRGYRPVRCTVAGTCQRVGRASGYALTVRRSG